MKDEASSYKSVSSLISKSSVSAIFALFLLSAVGQRANATGICGEGLNGGSHERPVPNVEVSSKIKEIGNVKTYSFIKDAPILGFQITDAGLKDLPQAIADKLGAIDQTKYDSNYFQQNAGSMIALQTTSDGRADFYPIGKDTFDSKYKAVGVEEVKNKNNKLYGKVEALIPEVLSAGHPRLIGALKSVQVKMHKLSDLGYPLNIELHMESPWGVQVKPAGQDAYITWDASKNMYYMINIDEGTGLPLSYVHHQVSNSEIQKRVAQSPEIQKYNFVKDAPILGFRITSAELSDVPKAIVERLGSIDQTSYGDKYLRDNVGSIFALQAKTDGTADFYVIGKETYHNKYREVGVSEVMAKNKKTYAKLTNLVPELLASNDARIVGVLKIAPVEMIKASDLGFALQEDLHMESPWGVQVKPAGQDAYITWDASQGMFYMINVDEGTGLPIAYLPLR